MWLRLVLSVPTPVLCERIEPFWEQPETAAHTMGTIHTASASQHEQTSPISAVEGSFQDQSCSGRLSEAFAA